MTYFNRPISKVTYLILVGLSFISFFGLWSFVSTTMESSDIFLPSPVKVLVSTWDLFSKHSFIDDIWASVWRVAAGFILALAVAVPIGILLGTFRYVEAIIQPLNDFLRYLPVAAMIPLTIIWVGIGDEQKILIIFLGTVFQLIPLVADSVALIPRNLVELGYTIGYRKWQIITHIVLPWCAPKIYDHARVSLGWAWSYLVVAELVAAENGIGHVIIQAQRFLQTGNVMSGILVIGLIGLFFDFIFRLPKHRLFPWTE